MTQMKQAREGRTTEAMQQVAAAEQVSVDWLRTQVARGRVVLPANARHEGLRPCGIGEGLAIKVNANIGTSSDRVSLEVKEARI